MLQTQKYLGKDNVLPSGRGGASSEFYNGKIIIFGGHFLLEEGKYQYLNDTWVFDTRSDFTWNRVKCRGDTVPPERYGHSSHVFDSKMIVFGGKGSNGENLNDLWYLDLNKFIWTLITPVSIRKPLGRSAHTSVLIRVIIENSNYNENNNNTQNTNKLLIHGGWNGEETFSDAWVFDTTSLIWSKVTYNIPVDNDNSNNTPSTGSIPTARYGHSLTQISPNSLLLFGGCILPTDNSTTASSTVASFIPVYSNEMKILEFDFSTADNSTKMKNNTNSTNSNISMAWTRCRSMGRSPTGRYGHSATLLGSVIRPLLVVVGGWGTYGIQTIETVNDSMAHSICVFDIIQREWFPIECNTNEYNLYKSSFYHSTVAAVAIDMMAVKSMTKDTNDDHDNIVINSSCNELFVYGGYDGSQALKYMLQLNFQFDL